MKNAELAEQYMYMAIVIARSYHGKIPFHVECEDIEGAAILGLVYASRDYDPKKQASFKTWATIRIVGCVKDWLGLKAVQQRPVEFPLDLVSKSRTSELDLDRLHEAIDNLPDQMKALILGRFFHGKTHEEVAKSLQLSTPRMWQLQRQALDRLKWSLECKGIHSVQDVL